MVIIEQQEIITTRTDRSLRKWGWWNSHYSGERVYLVLFYFHEVKFVLVPKGRPKCDLVCLRMLTTLPIINLAWQTQAHFILISRCSQSYLIVRPIGYIKDCVEWINFTMCFSEICLFSQNSLNYGANKKLTDSLACL